MILAAGASSVAPADDEVEGFAFEAYLPVKGQTQGSYKGEAPDVPTESLSLNFTKIQFIYSPT